MNLDTVFVTLELMWKGMLSIFIAMLIIAGIVVLIQKIPRLLLFFKKFRIKKRINK